MATNDLIIRGGLKVVGNLMKRHSQHEDSKDDEHAGRDGESRAALGHLSALGTQVRWVSKYLTT